jgi:hypothetical protein
MRLTKTHILAGLRCEKRLYYLLHHPERARKSRSTAAVTGLVVQRHARLEFPGGQLIERNSTDSDPFQLTQQCLHDPAVKTLFEAAITDDRLTVFIDVLTRAGEAWDLIEIKSSSRVKDEHIDDIAIQLLAIDQAGIPINRLYLMHINSDFEYQGDHDYIGLFVGEDVTDQVRRHLPATAGYVDRMMVVASGAEPVRHVGSHCKNPYPCEFKTYCEQQDTQYPASLLPNAATVIEKLLNRGIMDIRDIPPDLLTSETHQRIRRVTVQGVPELLPGAAEEINALAYPRYYLDFECIQFAIPIWQGTHPYDQLPFQWSCHIQSEDAVLTHHEFIDVSGQDPRREFAEALLEVCGETGPILVYNQSFEKRIVKELAKVLPDLGKKLLALNTRMVDLLPIVKRNYYHPQMKGSWSIKSVLPCLVPELSYSGLGEVQDGTQAQLAYFDMIGEKLTAREREVLKNDLLQYCKLDTYAMVAIAEKLCG